METATNDLRNVEDTHGLSSTEGGEGTPRQIEARVVVALNFRKRENISQVSIFVFIKIRMAQIRTVGHESALKLKKQAEEDTRWQESASSTTK